MDWCFCIKCAGYLREDHPSWKNSWTGTCCGSAWVCCLHKFKIIWWIGKMIKEIFMIVVGSFMLSMDTRLLSDSRSSSSPTSGPANSLQARQQSKDWRTARYKLPYGKYASWTFPFTSKYSRTTTLSILLVVVLWDTFLCYKYMQKKRTYESNKQDLWDVWRVAASPRHWGSAIIIDSKSND